MKLVSWNIQQGGGKRFESIAEQISEWNPDVVGISEFQDANSSWRLAECLSDLGLSHQSTTIDAVDRGVNFLLMASREPITVQSCPGILADSGRFLHAKIDDANFLLMHVPNRSEKKWQFHAATIDYFNGLMFEEAFAFGDTNTGVAGVDEESRFFNAQETNWFKEIQIAGWTDVWREQNPNTREFTWYSTAGNGFRLDQLFATEHSKQRVRFVGYDWGGIGRESKLSDHAAIIAEIDI